MMKKRPNNTTIIRNRDSVWFIARLRGKEIRMNQTDITPSERLVVMRSLRKKQFCRVELKPNLHYKAEEKDTRKPIFDSTRTDILRKSLNCKGKMIDGTDICKFPGRFLRSVSELPPKTPPATNALKVSFTIEA